jgi:hypothetical protein
MSCDFKFDYLDDQTTVISNQCDQLFGHEGAFAFFIQQQLSPYIAISNSCIPIVMRFLTTLSQTLTSSRHRPNNQTIDNSETIEIFLYLPPHSYPCKFSLPLRHSPFRLWHSVGHNCSFCQHWTCPSVLLEASSRNATSFIKFGLENGVEFWSWLFDGFFPASMTTMTLFQQSRHSAWLNAALGFHEVNVCSLRMLRRTGAYFEYTKSESVTMLIDSTLGLICHGKRDIICAQIHHVEGTANPAIKFMRQLLDMEFKAVTWSSYLFEIPCSLVRLLSCSAIDSQLRMLPSAISEIVLNYAPLQMHQINLKSSVRPPKRKCGFN